MNLLHWKVINHQERYQMERKICISHWIYVSWIVTLCIKTFMGILIRQNDEFDFFLTSITVLSYFWSVCSDMWTIYFCNFDKGKGFAVVVYGFARSWRNCFELVAAYDSKEKVRFERLNLWRIFKTKIAKHTSKKIF